MRKILAITASLCFLLLLSLAVTDLKAASAPKGEGDAKWNDLVTKAQKEGTVTVYCTALPASARAIVQQAFKKKYGINVEYTVGLGTELERKFNAETTAGLHIVDLFQVGVTNFTDAFRPMKVTIPLEPLLMLPDVIDPSKWRGGRLPFLDAEKHAFMLILLANNFYAINTDLVKMNEIRSTLDVLNPKFKDKIIMLDPSVPGNSNEWFTHTILRILGMERGEKFMHDLAKLDPIVVRDSRQVVEGVARGKYLLGIGASVSQPVEFIKSGAHIAFAKLNEPYNINAGGGIIFTLKEVPHPNATKLFINWLASQEGSSIYAPAHGYPSTRLDVSTEGILPAIIPAANEIMPADTEDYVARKTKLMKLAADIFGSMR